MRSYKTEPIQGSASLPRICFYASQPGKQSRKTSPRFSSVSLKHPKGENYEKVSTSRTVCTIQSTRLGTI